jgi:hypothetical protein
MGAVARPARAEGSRRNGRRSRGPVTPEGKERSSRNAVRHGVLTADVCAGNTPEQRAEFSALLDQLEAELAPSSVLERSIVELIAATLWRTRKVLSFEAGRALERDAAPNQLERLLRDLETEQPSDPEALERGQTLSRSLAPEGALDLAMRYETHLSRELSRLLDQLEQARCLCALMPSERVPD